MRKFFIGVFQALAGLIPLGVTTDLAHTEEDAERGVSPPPAPSRTQNKFTTATGSLADSAGSVAVPIEKMSKDN